MAARRGGAWPNSPVTEGADGNLYGLTELNGQSVPRNGGLYQVKPDGTVRTVYSFRRDRREPIAGLTATADGSLYGVTAQGGDNDAGTIFRLSASGGYQTVHSFFCLSSTGCHPRTALVAAPDGSLYGTTTSAVYRVAPDGSVSGILPLTCCAGPSPDTPLAFATDGNLYTMGDDGAFRLTPSGALTLLHAFDPLAQGAGPSSPLLQASDGNFYGTLSRGGPTEGGTVFRLRPDGRLTVLHAFATAPNRNVYPALWLQASDGYLYGTTQGDDGFVDSGSVWRLALLGEFSTVLTLSQQGGDAQHPRGLTETSDGRLVGTSARGGLQANGTLFVLTPAAAASGAR